MKFKWEEIANRTFRAKVIGGWIISNEMYRDSNITSSMVFVPDSLHKWEIEGIK